MIRRKGLRTLIKNDWQRVLKFEFDKPYFLKLEQFLLNERRHETVYPPSDKIFNAFNLCSFQNLKVVIIGQDPYHNPNEAHGLCFSVTEGVKQPPSLRNILKELNTDLGLERKSGNLEGWAKQGVLLLNTFLTVRENEPMSHQYSGWHIFTTGALEMRNTMAKKCMAYKQNGG